MGMCNGTRGWDVVSNASLGHYTIHEKRCTSISRCFRQRTNFVVLAGSVRSSPYRTRGCYNSHSCRDGALPVRGKRNMNWKRVITVVGAHAEGECGNVVTGGIVDIPGETMFDKKRYLEQHGDGLRKFLLFEPRGGPTNHTNIVLPSNHPDADFGFIIMESTEYPPMSDSNAICTATVILETGLFPMEEPETLLRLEAPGGLLEARCRCRNGKVEQVKITNVPAFALHLDASVEVEGIGTVRLDIAYGGMMFAVAEAADLGFELRPDEARDISIAGEKIKVACNEQLDTVHPENPEIEGMTIFELTGPVRQTNGGLAAKNTVVVSPGRLDRSPCGTGTSARLAVLHAKGAIGIGQAFEHESIIGTRFDAEVVATTVVAGTPAVITTIAGQAWTTGIMQFGLDPTDPFPEGYTLSDVWLSAI